MHAAVDDVHHRHRQQPRCGAADVAVKRQVVRHRRRFGDGERDTEDGVGAEPPLVGRAVERDHGLVDLDLSFGVHAAERVEQFAVDGFNGVAHAFAEITRPPSRNSTASCVPVEAPDGTPARPREPSAKITSTSTVGLPRLSRISRPTISTMAVMRAPGSSPHLRSGLLQDRRAQCHVGLIVLRVGKIGARAITSYSRHSRCRSRRRPHRASAHSR